MVRKKSMHVLAEECAERLYLNLLGKPDLIKAFEAGWRASTANRWPKAKVVKQRRHNRAPPEHEWDKDGKCIWCPATRDADNG